MHERHRDVLLVSWARFVCRYPRLVLSIAFIFAVVSVGITLRYLEFQPDRSALVDQNVSWNKRYADYKTQYPDWGNVLVVIASHTPPPTHISPTASTILDASTSDAEDVSFAQGATGWGGTDLETDVAARFAISLAGQLRQDALIRSVTAGYEATPRTARLLLAQPAEQFEAAFDGLLQTVPILEDDSLTSLLRTLVREMGTTQTSSEVSDNATTQTDAAKSLATFLEVLASSVDDPAKAEQRFFGSLASWYPLRSESGELTFLSIALNTDRASIDSVGQGIKRIRNAIHDLQQSDAAFAQLDAGVTGIPAIESDETTQSIHDSTIASIVAAVLITALMLYVYRGFIVPLFSMVALLIGVAWSFGYLTLVVGHLQVLSVVFTVILLGLGIDFSLHVMARLELIRDEFDLLEDAIARVYQRIGPGMLTGAITTAAAFGVTYFTNFKGVAEMGIIAGGGILLCLIAMLSVFPALLAMLPDWQKPIRTKPGGETAHFLHNHLDWIDRRPMRAIVLSGFFIVLFTAGAFFTRYDPNILNLHPPNIESVEWEQAIIDDSERTVWAGLSIANSIEDAEQRTYQFLADDAISRVEGIGLLFHPDIATRQKRFRAIMPIDISEFKPGTQEQILHILRSLSAGIQFAILQDITKSNELSELLDSIDASVLQITDRLTATVDDEPTIDRWGALESMFGRGRSELRRVWESITLDEPLQTGDLPEIVQAMNIGLDGSFLLRVHPDAADVSVLNPDRLERFVSAMRTVDVDILGPPIQIYESSRLIVRSYVLAAALAVFVILVVLLIDFRSLPDAICALLPVGFGFLGMFGVLGMTGFPINFANIIVMPLIFGIGVDSGVHIVHRWRFEPDGIPKGLSGGTGRGVTLTMLTTIIGFGCLLLAEHRGIRGLGFTMVIGLLVTLGGCYCALPAVLRLRSEVRKG